MGTTTNEFIETKCIICDKDVNVRTISVNGDDVFYYSSFKDIYACKKCVNTDIETTNPLATTEVKTTITPY